MTVRKFLAFMLAAVALMAFSACSDDDDDDNPMSADGFVAEQSDFDGYSGWDRIDYAVYPVYMDKLGPAHQGNDPSVVRDVYSNNADGYSNGAWEEGTIIVKEMHTFDGNQNPDFSTGGLFGMVKSNNSELATENAGWEYFTMESDGTIANRTMDGFDDSGCIGCHAVASDDHVFSHPASYELSFTDGADAMDWIETTSWEEIETIQGDDPNLHGAHGGDDANRYRTVYRWQPGAVYKDGIFPTGSVIAKKAYEDDAGTETLLAWTIMAKMDNDTWKWYMVTGDGTLVDPGTSDDTNDCTGCHSVATGDAGGDWVFLHDGFGN